MAKLILLGISLTLLASGCATKQVYEGQGRSADEVALIEPRLRFGPGPGVAIQHVDGTALDRWSWRIEVLPGAHIVKAFLVTAPYGGVPMTSPPRTIAFEAAGGNTDVVDYKMTEHSWTLLVRDKKTGKVVAEE